MYGDHLWSSLGGQEVPNEGFLHGAVVPLGYDPQSAGALEGHDEGSEGGGEEPEGGGGAEGPSSSEPAGAAGDGEQGEAGARDAAVRAAFAAAALQQLELGAEEERGGEASTSGGAAEVDMDELLEAALLQVGMGACVCMEGAWVWQTEGAMEAATHCAARVSFLSLCTRRRLGCNARHWTCLVVEQYGVGGHAGGPCWLMRA